MTQYDYNEIIQELMDQEGVPECEICKFESFMIVDVFQNYFQFCQEHLSETWLGFRLSHTASQNILCVFPLSKCRCQKSSKLFDYLGHYGKYPEPSQFVHWRDHTGRPSVIQLPWIWSIIKRNRQSTLRVSALPNRHFVYLLTWTRSSDTGWECRSLISWDIREVLRLTSLVIRSKLSFISPQI